MSSWSARAWGRGASACLLAAAFWSGADAAREAGREPAEGVEADDGTVVPTDDLLLVSPEDASRWGAFAWDVRATGTGASLRLGGARTGTPLAVRLDDRGRRGGALSLASGDWTLRSGTLRFDHGFGLLALGAGRWRRVSASQSLGRPRCTVGAYTGVDPDRMLTGAAVSLAGDSLGGDVVVGGPGEAGLGGGGRVWAARVRSESAGVSASAVGTNGVLAGSLLLEGAWESGTWGAEAAAAAGGGAARRAGAARIEWRGERRGLQFLAVAGDDLDTPLSDGLPLVPGPTGGAWAIRGWTTGGEVRWSLLVYRGTAWRERSGVFGDETRHRLETGARWRTSGGTRLEARVRRDDSRRLGWTTARPWEPPGVDWARTDWSLTLKATGDWRGWNLVAGTAARMLDEAGERRSRRLVRLQGERPLGGGGTLRLGHAWSWGGALDLMTADAPAPGLLAVRHARHLERLWTAGWASRMFGLRTSLAAEVLKSDGNGGVTLEFGIRARVRSGG